MNVNISHDYFPANVLLFSLALFNFESLGPDVVGHSVHLDARALRRRSRTRRCTSRAQGAKPAVFLRQSTGGSGEDVRQQCCLDYPTRLR